ncbi:ATP-binding protein [Actinoplanes sp. CA-054009]
MTLRQLAGVSGYARSTLSLAENGTRLPGWAVTEAYVRACGHRDLSRWRGWWEAAGEEPAAAGAGPEQLPADVRGFVGREEQLRLLDEAAPVVTISGAAGVGKTSLAVHWGHRRGCRHPDGRLYVNLRGFSGGEPMTAEEALRALLDALGVAPGELPSGVDALAARYRSLVAGRRLLIVLDNARDAAHVRPLLPGAGTVRTLVTSRNQLAGLAATDGAQPLALAALGAADGRDLLVSRLNGDVGGAERVVRLCGGLPLALSIVAARARLTGFPLAVLADELGDGDGVLEPLTAGDEATDIRTVFSWSYGQLGDGAARLFRLLSLAAGPDLGEDAAAALAGADPAECRRWLGELVDASLLETPVPRRFVFHDLLKTYARSLVCRIEEEADRRAAVRRLLDHWLGRALAADRLLRPRRDPMPLAAVTGEVTPFAGPDEARAWLEGELKALLAAVRQASAEGFDGHAFQLVWALNSYLRRRGNWPEWTGAWQMALEAARRLGEPAAQGMALRGLAFVSTVDGKYEDALAGLAEAGELYRRAGDAAGEAQTTVQLCTVHSSYGNPVVALEFARKAERLFDAVGHRRGAASALNYAGWILGQLGRHHEAVAMCRRSVELHRRLGDRYEEALALDSLGTALSRLGRHDEAVGTCRRAAELHHDMGDEVHEAGALDSLGEAHAAAGDHEAARQAWREAYDLLHRLEHPQAATVEAKLSGEHVTVGPL